jgi:hypothetical protein
MGNASAFGRQFRGELVVRAVFADLVRRRGLGTGNEKDKLIFGGQSAGGRGAMVHLDYIPEMLGKSAASNVEVVGFLDSPLWLDMPPFNTKTFHGFGADCQGVYSFANVRHLGEECMAMHSGENAWKCIMGQYRLAHVKTPHIIVASQYDSFQLGMNGIFPPADKLTQAQRAYAEDFAGRTSSLMKTLRSPASQTLVQNAVLSWACYDHASSLTHYGFDQQRCHPSWRGPLTLDTALMEFWRSVGSKDFTSHRFDWIDTCHGFSCGKGCTFAVSQELSASEPPATASAPAPPAPPAPATTTAPAQVVVYP